MTYGRAHVERLWVLTTVAGDLRRVDHLARNRRNRRNRRNQLNRWRRWRRGTGRAAAPAGTAESATRPSWLTCGTGGAAETGGRPELAGAAEPAGTAKPAGIKRNWRNRRCGGAGTRGRTGRCGGIAGTGRAGLGRRVVASLWAGRRSAGGAGRRSARFSGRWKATGRRCARGPRGRRHRGAPVPRGTAEPAVWRSPAGFTAGGGWRGRPAVRVRSGTRRHGGFGCGGEPTRIRRVCGAGCRRARR
ncbi:hypothetical protein BC793_117125 [Actinoplanes xinjiangensis]|uniref:Uncharacterized protein n=1 Tax=Actinoplanes xinjiangensis TaxID=512350 RepID=A0A316FQN9_9ACTN|nr:hypothetical protein BC793_117125 [Actinoplanes xinjiangensis]